MVRKRKPLPTVGELVVGTVTKVFDYGAYLNLDEYGGKEAYFCLLYTSPSPRDRG